MGRSIGIGFDLVHSIFVVEVSMSRLSRPIRFTFVLALATTWMSGCATTGRQYSSGENGPIDCKDFPITSDRKDLKPDHEKSCSIFTPGEVELTATAYIRSFESNTGFMNVLLQRAGIKTYVKHRDVQALVSSFDLVRNKGVNWEALPPIDVNGRTYKLQKFSLNQEPLDCIGFANYGNSVDVGYRSILQGFSCKYLQLGKINISDLKKDLEALRFRQ
jgi:hypothetical protein